MKTISGIYPALFAKQRHILMCVMFSWCVLVANAGDEIYNPISASLRWVADVTMTTPDGKTTKGTATREIKGTEVIKGKTYFISVTGIEGIPGCQGFTDYVRNSPEGEFTISATDAKKQEYLNLPYPLVVGKTWEVPSEEGKLLYKVECLESVTVGTVRYEKCFKVSYRYENIDYRSEFYLAPNIGNVMETTKANGVTMVFIRKLPASRKK